MNWLAAILAAVAAIIFLLDAPPTARRYKMVPLGLFFFVAAFAAQLIVQVGPNLVISNTH